MKKIEINNQTFHSKNNLIKGGNNPKKAEGRKIIKTEKEKNLKKIEKMKQ